MEKKSERLEVRLGYEEKQTFTQACENQGDTPSGAIRRFIKGYVRRADADLFASAWRGLRRRKLVLGGLAALTSAAVIAFGFGLYSFQASKNYADSPIHYDVFANFDANNDGILQVGDIAPTDHHIHKVLDIDGNPGISISEFWANGRMLYGETASENIIFDNAKNGTVHVREFEKRFVVAFDFRKKSPQIAVYKYATDKSTDNYDRTVVWTGNPRPGLQFSNDDYKSRT